MMTESDKIFSKEESCLSFNVMMDYIHDRLSNKERNHVEKHMLQCEFCSEAMEGLSLIDENKGKEMIESIDETNQLEQQILFAANEAPVLEESAADYERAGAPQKSAPAMRKMKKAEAPPAEASIQEINNKKSFDWRRLAAVLIGALFIGGGLIYFIRKDFNAGNTRVAVESKPSISIHAEPKINNSDSSIAITHDVSPSETAIRESKPNSDAILYSSNKENRKQENNKIELNNEGLVKELKKIAPAEASNNISTQDALPAPIKDEVNEEAESIVEKNMDKRVEEVKIESYSITQINQEKELRVAKSKKGDIKSAAARAEIAADTLAVGEYKITNDFDKGVKLYTNGEYWKAINYFDKLDKKDINYEEARWYLAKSYIAIGEKEKAKVLFKEVVEMNSAFKAKAEGELKKLE